MEPWRFRGLREKEEGAGRPVNPADAAVFYPIFKWDFGTHLCLCMRRTLSGLMWLWEDRIPLGELIP